MENQDKLFNQIKAAADHAETPDFASMDKVWHRVEEKLDTKILKKENTLWKKIAVAASLLLVATLGYQLFNQQPVINQQPAVTQKDSLPNSSTDNTAIVAKDETNPAIKKDAGTLLEKQLHVNHQVAYEEDAKGALSADSISIGSSSNAFTTVVVPNANTWEGSYKDKSANTFTWSTDKKEEVQKAVPNQVELFVGKENKVSGFKKEQPLIVYDDKVKNKQSINEMDAGDIESLVELKEPLYIINGIYYTEQELFGPNPTSPYSPLNQQEIETISVLQNEKAVEVYGEKGKKGVVIITTKNGKPVEKKKNNSVLPLLDKSKK